MSICEKIIHLLNKFNILGLSLFVEKYRLMGYVIKSFNGLRLETPPAKRVS